MFCGIETMFCIGFEQDITDDDTSDRDNDRQPAFELVCKSSILIYVGIFMRGHMD